VRGKHANAAKNRREREELEQRAATAERRAERLDEELAATKERYERRIAALQAEATQVAQERDAAVSPELEAERKAADHLRAELRDRARAVSWIDRLWKQTVASLPATLASEGLQPEQITRVMKTLVVDGKRAAFGLRADAYAGQQSERQRP
jgi:chromosome segregation ATPase